MEKRELDIKMNDMAKSILSYCMARTSNHFEAEDLAQDIIVEIYKSADNIRNADAFYSFMWTIAGNVYKQWCKKKAKNKECEITDDLFNVAVAELVKKGYVLNDNGKLVVNVPVFTKKEFEQFMSQFNSTVELVEQNANAIMNAASKIIKNYIPVHLKSQAYQMAYFRIFEEAISMPVGTLVENNILFPYNGNGVLPTTYIILK